MSESSKMITGLLGQIAEGDRQAQDRLFRLMETELRRIAGRHMRSERSDHTLQTTVLVDDAFVALVGGDNEMEWSSRSHFFRTAARVMRRILIDYERRRRAGKRGGEKQQRIEFDPNILATSENKIDLLALDEALDKLAQIDPRQAEIVELRHFGGYTVQETAELLGVSTSTVKQEFACAKLWLKRELKHGDDA